MKSLLFRIERNLQNIFDYFKRKHDIDFTFGDDSDYQLVRTHHNWVITPQGAYTDTGDLYCDFRPNASKRLEIDTAELPVVSELMFVPTHLVDHWGHFILDALGGMGALVLNKSPTSNIMIVAYDCGMGLDLALPERYAGIPGAIEQNIVRPDQIPEKSYVVKTLYVTDGTASFTNQELIKPHVIITQTWADYYRTDEPPTTKKRVFLSRAGRGLNRQVPQIDRLEQALLDTGQWDVVYLQDYSIAEQINILENAEVVAGVIGSAFHTLLLTRKFTGKVIFLSAGEWFLNLIYAKQCMLMDHDAEFIFCLFTRKNSVTTLVDTMHFTESTLVLTIEYLTSL